MKMKLNGGPENDPSSIKDAMKEILNFLEQGRNEATQTVLGDRFGGESEYGSGHYEAKDRREIYATFEKIFHITDEEAGNFASVEEYLMEKGAEIMKFDEAYYRAVTDFIEREFGVIVEPKSGPTDHYMACVRSWANEFGVTEDYIKNVIPYEKFKTMDDYDIVDLVYDHFGEE